MTERPPIPRREPWFSRAALALGGALGASGVALSALAAHDATASGLAAAAQIALVHGAAAIGLSAAARCGADTLGFRAAALILLGGALVFCGDLTLRWAAERALFPMAAPLGGGAMILGWSLLGVVGMLGAFRGHGPTG